MHAAYNGIGRSPTEVDYVECHATGTSVGDPVEANWVGNHFKRDSELLIGSVKGNIGWGLTSKLQTSGPKSSLSIATRKSLHS
jgi:3-oxoacyl-(acyl-carrier-protein) synthase